MKLLSDTMPPKQGNNNEMIPVEKIFEFIPHRYPFLLVDRVLELEEGKSLTAIKNVTYNEYFFQGHFPEKKIMPGVLILEALAQSGAILLSNTITNPDNKLFLMSKIEKVRFRKPVIPGDQLKLKAEIIKLKNRFCLMRGTAYVDGEIVTEGEIMASIMDLGERNDRK